MDTPVNLISGEYTFEFYSKSDPNSREYWGSQKFTVPEGGTDSKTFTRNEPYVEWVKFFDGSTEITGASVAIGKQVKIQVRVRNDSVARIVTPKVWLDRDKAGTADHLVIFAAQNVGGSLDFNTATFEEFVTFNTPGDYYRKLELRFGTTLTDSWPYGPDAGPAITTTLPPEAVVMIEGNPTQLQPGKRYTVIADFESLLGMSAVTRCLRIRNPAQADTTVDLAIKNYVYSSGAGPETHVTLYPEQCSVTDIPTGQRVAFTFSLSGLWPECNSGLEFATRAVNDAGTDTGWIWKATTCKFVVPCLPKGKWTVFSHGKTGDDSHIDLTFGGVLAGMAVQSISWAKSLNGTYPSTWASGITDYFEKLSTFNSDGYAYNIGRRILQLNPNGHVMLHRTDHSSGNIMTWQGNPQTGEGTWINDANAIHDGTKHHYLMFDWVRPSNFIESYSGQDDWYAYGAADALYTTLFVNSIQDKVNILIGHSRGAVVCSEVARRQLLRGYKNFQVVYLDAEGWSHGLTQFFVEGYQDATFRAWKDTRTDQYRQETANFFMAYCGAESLIGGGNDKIIERWPMGTWIGATDKSGEEACHDEFPEYFIDWMYVVRDNTLSGSAGEDRYCLETPQIGDTANLTYPTLQATAPENQVGGFYGAGFGAGFSMFGGAEGSAAGWAYHGGYADNDGYDEINSHGCLHFSRYLTSARYMHNWQVVPSNVSTLKFRYDTGNLFSSSGILRFKWDGSEIGAVPFGTGTDGFVDESIVFNYSVGSVGRLEVVCEDMPIYGGAFVDDFEFISNLPPSIGSLVATPASLMEGELLNLAAQNVSDVDGSVQSVEFWHVIPSGGEEKVHVNTLGAPPGGTWYANIRVSGYATGIHTFKARAKDNKGRWSEWKSCTVTITVPVNAPPQIGTFSVSPTSLERGDDSVLTALNVTDDVGIERVTFYRDNGDGVFNASTDASLGDGLANGTTYSLTVSSSGFPVGNSRLWAVAYDNLGVSSLATYKIVEVQQFWTLDYAVSPGGAPGSITPNPVEGRYEQGTTVRPTASANTGWYLHHWESNGQATGLPISLMADTTVTAVFSQIVVQAQAPIIVDISDHSTPSGVPYSRKSQLSQGYPSPSWSFVGSVPSGMTINSTDGTVTWPNPQPLDQSFTVSIRATNSEGSDEETWTLRITATGQVSQPQFSPAGGVFSDALDVTLTCSTLGATIRYTLDGSIPTTNSLSVANGGKVTISETKQLKARAFKEGWLESLTAEAIYSIPSTRVSISYPLDLTMQESATSRVDIVASSLEGLTRVEWFNNSVSAGTNVLSTPVNSWSNSFVWGGFKFGTNTLTAVATDFSGWSTTSTPVRIIVTKDIVATPTFDPNGGVYSESAINVIVTCATEGSTLRYTTDGSEPTETSSVVSSGSSVSVPIPCTLKAKAWKTGWNTSESRIARYNSSVQETKQIIALPIGPNTSGFHGFTDLGAGTIVAPTASPSLWNASEAFYTFYFSSDELTAQLQAIPSPYQPGVKQSYFFAWDGPLAAFQNPLHVTQPLAPVQTVIVLPTGTIGTGSGSTLNGTMVQVSAIFTVEYNANDNENPTGVNNGDLNQDGVPDRLVNRYFIDPMQEAGPDATLNEVWFQNLGGFNDDEDYMPVYPTGDELGVLDFRPVANPRTAQGDMAVNAFTAFVEIRGYDGCLGTADDPLTDPTLNDTDDDGYPDGWEYWFWYQSKVQGRLGSRYNPFNIAQGDVIDWTEIVFAFDPMSPRSAYTDVLWRDDFDNDGLLDLEELVLGTDPTNWDTDGDIMADGWEILNGFHPGDPGDGNLPVRNNPDGDYFAISTALRRHIQVVTTNGGFNDFGDPIVSLLTNHYFMAVDTNTFQVIPGTVTTAYRYGNDLLGPWAVGRPAPDSVLMPANIIPGPTDEDLNPLVIHFQVRNESQFDPRTGWCNTVARGPNAAPPTAWPYANADRFGLWGGAPNTRSFTAVDEYLLLKFMYELRLNGMVATNNSGWIARFERAINLFASNNNAIVFNNTRRILIQESWSQFTTHPRTPDTDADVGGSDGIPDGWELYVAVPPGAVANVNVFTHSPWAAPDATSWEYWGTDSIKVYTNAAQYYFGMINNNPMIGVVTIIRPVDDPDNYWVNKFWPTDPFNNDTDFDGLSDVAERAFMYGNAVDTGVSCIAGGGLNPCSVDTDRDALPDIWESQFAGTPVDAEGNTSLPPLLPGQPEPYVAMTIENGQDGTVADAYKDADFDGLVSYQEYMTQALRCYRYDIPLGLIVNDTTVTDPVTRKMGQPMDISFEIGALFEPVTNLWDQCMFGWPDPMDILWWMRPAGERYCSTDPNNPDTDFDNMDDYYEIFHGLNPLLGNGARTDLMDDRVAWAYEASTYPGIGMPPFAYNNNWYFPLGAGFTMDFVQYPWLNGMPSADSDADGLLNMEEMLAVNMPVPENQNTDPSPFWATDPSNLESITARFYTPWNRRSAYRPMFFWEATVPPLFTFKFEMNEGYDTDNDGLSDKDEKVANRNPKSDSRDSEDPNRRQAIWFSGTNSAATTPCTYTDLPTIVGQSLLDKEQAFRSFTVELWVRPEWATNRCEQILIERGFDYGQNSDTPRLRRNFIIGIAPDGRIFGGFDNAGGHDEHADSVRLYGENIGTNNWVHLAARMDGRTQKFTLFANGVSQGEMSTTLIPATGLDPARYTVAPEEVVDIISRKGTLTLGAANIDMVSLDMGIGFDLAVEPLAMTWGASWLTGYEKFYRGWLDEVRVWDGARSNQQITDNFRMRFTRDDLLANRKLILEELNNGASRNALSENNVLSPILVNYYNFNNLFSATEVQYVAQVPLGYNSVLVNASRPNRVATGAIVNWWNTCEVKNTVYNNWHYLPWIENVVGHLPCLTTVANGVGGNIFVNDSEVVDSIYWSRPSAVNTTAQNSLLNNNPYGFLYGVERTIDLLPIGDAWAKQCTDFWDDLGAADSWLEDSGTTDDGLPTWWKLLHGTTGGWTDLYTGANTYYSDNGMTNGEVYQRDLAMGMLPTAYNITDYTTAYKQTADSNDDGIPNWWKRMYGLSILDRTGDSGPLGDPDRDGLSNFAEYQITDVYKIRHSNPLKFKSLSNQPVSDYFMKPTGGRLIFGAMFSDHDFVEDWWEEMYEPAAATPHAFDPKTDYDSDGWSNWAEARYSQSIATVRPDLREIVMVNGITVSEYPVPIIDARINYTGIQTNKNLMIQAFSSSEMLGFPDARWNINFDSAGSQQNAIPLGFYAAKTIRTRLSPGSVVPGTIHIQLTDTWTGVTDITAFDMNGVIYSMTIDGFWDPIGTVNYITGEMVLEMGTFEDVNIILDEAAYPADRNSYIEAAVSYFEMTYETQLPTGWPQHIYLGRAATGTLKEGKNYFFAFIDVDGNETWDPGEPAGISTPFETDIGWDENTLDIQLTDYTPNNLRLSLSTGLRSEDVLLGATSGEATGIEGTTFNRVRIIRADAQNSSFTSGPVFDKVIYGRDYIHEGDLINMPNYGGYGLDWNFGDNGILTPSSVGSITYKVYVGDIDEVTNNTLVATFTNTFDSSRAVAIPVLPLHGDYVYTARPTFSWSVVPTNKGYNAFGFELRRGSSTGPLVYPVTIRQVPIRDLTTGNYMWEAPFYMGDKNTVNNGVYYWRVQLMNPQFSVINAVVSEWSPWRIFRWDVSQLSSEYGQIRAVVKYFGVASNLADRVVFQVYNNRGFAGDPKGQFSYAVSQIGLITNLSLSVTNAISVRGLTPGTYYARAFIDSNSNGKLDSWESWGYANYYGEAKSIYDVRPIEVSDLANAPNVTVFIEDSDVDQDGFPDVYEYEQNPVAPDFLALMGPPDGWIYSYSGDAEINPTLNNSSFINMLMFMINGTSDQQRALLGMSLAGTDSDTCITPNAVDIRNLSIGATGASINWDLTPRGLKQTENLFFNSILSPLFNKDFSQERTYTYKIRFSTSLDVPRSEWIVVKQETISVNTNGKKTITSVLDDMPVLPTSGFYFLDITE